MENGAQRIFNGLSELTDLIILNVLFLITCLPIVTIGTATTSMYTYLIRCARGDERPLAKSYFKLFKENFKKTVGVWVLLLLALVVLVIDANITTGLSDGLVLFFQVIVILGTFIIVSVWIYYMSWTGLFENTVRETFRNALLLTFSKAPWSLLMVVIWLSPLVMFLIPDGLGVSLTFFVLLWPTVAAWINARILLHIYQPFLKDDEATQDSEWPE